MTFNDNASLDTSEVESGGGGGFGGGGGGFGGGRLATGGIGGIILLILSIVFGQNLLGSNGGGSNNVHSQSQSYQQGQQGDSGYSQNTNYINGSDDTVAEQIAQCRTGRDANSNDTCRIVGTVNAVQSFWAQALPTFTNNRYTYSKAMTVIYSGQTQSACGTANNQVGPFYCPLDRKVYIDAAFFQQLTSQFGADGGNLAKEYVVAHEYGHHIQDILGLLSRAQSDPQGANSGSVRTELQADCFAGIWVKHATEAKDANGNSFLEPITKSDIRSALSAASAVGDDRIQEKAQGAINPETWTHGSSEEREKWFMTGYTTGQLNACDTFSATNLN